MLTKNTTLSVKDVDVKSGIVTGYAAAFDNVDSDGDVFRKGAFTKSVSERGPSGTNQQVHLLQHNILQPLGKPHVLREDEKGLYFETKLAKTSYGKDTLELYREGIYNEHSVGFKTIQEEAKSEFNEITEVKLFEFSTVTLGANSQTPFTGFKATERLELLTKALRNGSFTDDTFALLEIEFNQLKALMEPDNTPEPQTGELISAFKSKFNF